MSDLAATPRWIHLVRLTGLLMVLAALGTGFVGLDTLIILGVAGRDRLGYVIGLLCFAATWCLMSFGFRFLTLKQKS